MKIRSVRIALIILALCFILPFFAVDAFAEGNTCKYCGAEIPDGAVICGSCGICQECGKDEGTGNDVCFDCGAVPACMNNVSPETEIDKKNHTVSDYLKYPNGDPVILASDIYPMPTGISNLTLDSFSDYGCTDGVNFVYICVRFLWRNASGIVSFMNKLRDVGYVDIDDDIGSDAEEWFEQNNYYCVSPETANTQFGAYYVSAHLLANNNKNTVLGSDDQKSYIPYTAFVVDGGPKCGFSGQLVYHIYYRYTETDKTERLPDTNACAIIQLDDGTYVTVDSSGNINTDPSYAGIITDPKGVITQVTGELQTPTGNVTADDGTVLDKDGNAVGGDKDSDITDGVVAGAVAMIFVLIGGVSVLVPQNSVEAQMYPHTNYSQEQLGYMAENELRHRMDQIVKQVYEEVTAPDFSMLGMKKQPDGTWVSFRGDNAYTYDRDGNLTEICHQNKDGTSTVSVPKLDSNGNIVSTEDKIYSTDGLVGTSKTTYSGGEKTVSYTSSDGSEHSVLEYGADGSIKHSVHYANGKISHETGSYTQTQQGSTGVGGYTEKTTTYTYEKIYDSNGNLKENRVTDTSTGRVSTYDGKGDLIAGFNVKTGKTVVPKK